MMPDRLPLVEVSALLIDRVFNRDTADEKSRIVGDLNFFEAVEVARAIRLCRAAMDPHHHLLPARRDAPHCLHAS